MLIEILVPSVGESVQEAILAEWYKKDGDVVQKDEPLFVMETDKVSLEVVAEAAGVLKILVPDGETVTVGAVVGTIDTEAAVAQIDEPAPLAGAEKASPAAPEAQEEPAPVTPAETEKVSPAPPSPAPPPEPEPMVTTTDTSEVQPILSPSVRRLVAQQNIDVTKIDGTGPGGRITKGDVLLELERKDVTIPEKQPAPPSGDSAVLESTSQPPMPPAAVESITRKPMSAIRRRIAAHLLDAKQNTAMLTTFNEIDMQRVKTIRSQFKESFKEKHDVSLGMMSFFIKASVEALKDFPEINAFIDGQDIIYNNYYHIGVAIGSEKGLVVPVIRHADQLSFAQLEQAIIDYVVKIRENRLELADLGGGTFTISNGGVYGSLLSTPILNMPQSGILGMHKIENRPVAINGEVVIRPMMYVALSYDHRIVDGREAVTFLKRIKECVENPERIMMEV
jgi:2-oxoglutarate dehydrogenase E2 component (dihydrolipoamide succinyltransferase)